MTERTEEKRQHRLLVVEDEPSIRTLLESTLSLTGYHVRSTDTGAAALAEAARLQPDLILLDIMLPDLDGYEVTRRLRAAGNLVPVLLLTARTGVDDRIKGLSLGADDYVTKPFNARELVARIKSILRRASAPVKTSKRLESGRIQIDAARRECLVDGEQVMLAPKEFDLLWELLERNGDVLNREELLEKVWGYTFVGDTRTVDVHVRQLRKKLGDDCPIVTVWGSGYKVGTEVQAA